MSWTDELYKIYELNCKRKFDDNEPTMLPISHSTAKAQVEVTINENGEFKGARSIEKEDAVTVIPVTEDSGARSSGIFPMPYADKLVYIAGDYHIYTDGKRNDNSDYYSAYLKQLKSWADSEHSHFAVNALYTYIKKGCIIYDLIMSGVLITNEHGKLSPEHKIDGISQPDAFVRFIVNTPDSICRTWEDKSLQNSFIAFNQELMSESQLCYASGKYEPVTYKHPNKIRNSGDKAKIISSNDDSGFSYRGRFLDKEQAVSVSYDYSQKIHNALRWLVKKQGQSFDSLTVLVWATDLIGIPDASKNDIYEDDGYGYEPDENSAEDERTDVLRASSEYMHRLKRYIFKYYKKMEPNTKVMVMGLDSANPGRLNISFYRELLGSDFLRNIERWHSGTAWYRFDPIKKKRLVNSFNIYEIIRYALGIERNEKIDLENKYHKNTFLRMLSCITEGRDIPENIMNSLYQKASNPLAYKNSCNHNIILETACGMIRRSIIKQNNFQQEGEYLMSYDPNITDRSYLYGCLLAIADKADVN